MANPIVSIAVPVAGVVAAVLGNKAAAAGWGAVFGEEAPTPKAQKKARKQVARERKQAKKDGASKAEIAQISEASQEAPVWKLALWTVVSGLVLQGLKVAAQRGTRDGLERMMRRRPRPNRG